MGCLLYSFFNDKVNFLEMSQSSQFELSFVDNAVSLLPAMVSMIDERISAYYASLDNAGDHDVCSFFVENNRAKQVLAVCSLVPKGKVVSYGVVGQVLETYEFRCATKAVASASTKQASRRSLNARKSSASRCSRFVGSVLHRNPFAPSVPCHRVVAHDGKLTGFAQGLCRKASLLAEEGVLFRRKSVSNPEKCVVHSSAFLF